MIKSKANNILCQINLLRMKDYVSLRDACNYIGLPVDMLRQLPSVEPINTKLPESQRDISYHLGKIKFFMENKIDVPIDIDCFCRDGRVYNWPVIIDGRHRYIAALLRGDKLMPATFSGPSGLLDYLTYQSNNKPSYAGNIL